MNRLHEPSGAPTDRTVLRARKASPEALCCARTGWDGPSPSVFIPRRSPISSFRSVTTVFSEMCPLFAIQNLPSTPSHGGTSRGLQHLHHLSTDPCRFRTWRGISTAKRQLPFISPRNMAEMCVATSYFTNPTGVREKLFPRTDVPFFRFGPLREGGGLLDHHPPKKM